MHQKQNQIIFRKVRALLKKHAPPMVVSKDQDDHFELIGNKPVPYGAKKQIVPGMYFASAAIKKNSVNFYFFPIYFNPPEFGKKIPGLMKCLKGKTCFHFKKPEDVIEKELAALLRLGVKAWEKEGYMDNNR